MAQDNFIDAKKIIDELNVSFNTHQKVINEAATSLVVLNKEYKKLPSEYIASQKEIARLNVLIEKSEQATMSTKQKAISLSETQRKANEAILNSETKNIAAKERAAAASQRAAERAIKESGAYYKLSQAQAKAATTVQNLIAEGKKATQTQKQYNTELERAQKDFNVLNQKVLLADRAVGRFNRHVGNYPTQAVKTIRDLIGAFGIMGGVALFAQISKNIYNTTKEIQSLDLAMKSVTETQAKYTESQAFLSNIANKYGLEINNLTKQFTAFYVAAKDKISGSEIQEIFENISRSGSALGLSNEALERSFMAVNQMLSKGTVASEELRGQLAESMPGAVQAMTKAVQKLHPEIKNLTEKGLFQMIKDGKILASEVLPETARQLALITGADKAEGIETLAKITNRLSNEWTDLVRALTQADVGTVFGQTFKGATILAGGLLTVLREIASTQRQISSHEHQKGLGEGMDIAKEDVNNQDFKDNDERVAYLRKSIAEQVDILNNNYIPLYKQLNKELSESTFPYFEGALKDRIKGISEQIGIERGSLMTYRNLLDEILNPKKPTGSGGDDKKPKQEHIKLNFDYVKSEYELKKAIVQRQLAQINDNLSNEENSLETRLKYRKEFSEKSMELMLLELEMAKAINTEKNKDDIEKNNVAFKNKKITLQEYNQNIIDYNRDFAAKNGSADVAYSEKYRELVNADLEFYKKAEDEKREFVKKTNESILTFEKDKYKRISDNELLTVAVRQKAFDEYSKLARKEMDLAKIKELSNSKSAEETEFIIEKYRELNAEFDRVNTEESPQALRMKELTSQAKEFIKTMSDGFLDKAGFGALQMFADMDKEGMSTFERLIEGAKTTGEKMAIAFQGVGDVAQEVFNKISEMQQQRYEADIKRLESQKDIEIQFAGDSTTAKAEIERQYEEKRKALERRKAEQALKMAKFNIIIDTAQAVVGALAEQNYAGAILYGLIGAAELAVVSSQPIPAYAEGGVHDGGQMLVNDAKGSDYRETIVTPDGKITRPTGRNVLMNAPKGTEIFTPDQWQNQLNNLLLSNGISPSLVNLPDGNGMTMEQMETAMTNALRNMPQPESFEINFNERGMNIWKKENGRRKEVLNSRLRTKSRNV